jgi:hypothetical protein
MVMGAWVDSFADVSELEKTIPAAKCLVLEPQDGFLASKATGIVHQRVEKLVDFNLMLARSRA